MWLKSHHWVNEPHFKTEIKKTLDVVRTPTLSFMLFDKKSYDYETSKFCTDKLKTLNSISLADLIEEDIGHDSYRPPRSYMKHVEKWFTPKDNDFDEECEGEEKEREIKREKERLLKIEKEKKLELEAKNKIEEMIAARNEKLRQIKKEQDEYIITGGRVIRECVRTASFANIKLNPGEEVILIHGMPILDENGDIKIFAQRKI